MAPAATGESTAQASGGPVRELLTMILGHHATAIVGTVARLDLPEHLSAHPRTAADLADVTGADPATLLRLLRAAASLGLLREPQAGSFALTQTGALLRHGPRSLHQVALAASEPIHRRTTEPLHEAVLKNRAVAGDIAGVGMGDHGNTHPRARLALTNRLIDIDSAIVPTLCDTVDLARFKRIVVVGGDGSGLLARLLRLAPEAEGVLFDRPAAIEHARATVDVTGIGARVRLVSGDYLEKVPPGGDLYVLMGVLHDCADEPAAWLLDSCYMAALPGSMLLAFEGVLADQPPLDPVGHLIDIDAMLTMHGRERTVAELEELLNGSGYELTRVDLLPQVRYRPFAMLQARRS